jgi:thiamine pyrophosphate-dependent acetolactate synthase large subunit-like protein
MIQTLKKTFIVRFLRAMNENYYLSKGLVPMCYGSPATIGSKS